MPKLNILTLICVLINADKRPFDFLIDKCPFVFLIDKRPLFS